MTITWSDCNAIIVVPPFASHYIIVVPPFASHSLGLLDESSRVLTCLSCQYLSLEPILVSCANICLLCQYLSLVPIFVSCANICLLRQYLSLLDYMPTTWSNPTSINCVRSSGQGHTRWYQSVVKVFCKMPWWQADACVMLVDGSAIPTTILHLPYHHPSSPLPSFFIFPITILHLLLLSASTWRSITPINDVNTWLPFTLMPYHRSALEWRGRHWNGVY